MVDITPLVKQAVRDSKIEEGLCCVFVPHTTAGVIVNENADRDVKADIIGALSRLVPASGDYRHIEGNSDAHIKSCLVGNSITVPVEGGVPVLGTWQGIYFCEFDGPRKRKVLIKIIKNV
jgi:secondary thiamine-phosphate synthase enzyme